MNVRGVSSVLHELTVHWEGQTRKEETITPSERNMLEIPAWMRGFPSQALHRVQENRGELGSTRAEAGAGLLRDRSTHDAQVQGEDVREKRVCVSAAGRPENGCAHKMLQVTDYIFLRSYGSQCFSYILITQV